MAEYEVVAIEGLSALGEIESLSERERIAAIRAVNKTADRARTAASRLMRSQVDFTASYLNERLTVAKRASGTNLEAVIRGRDRPTSLARFVTGNTKAGSTPVMVKPGVAKFVKRSFIMKLRGAGGELTNRGLAVRTSGGPPKGAYKPARISDTLWLLYGVSVDQAFRSVRGEITPDAAIFLEAEFLRLMALDGVA